MGVVVVLVVVVVAVLVVVVVAVLVVVVIVAVVVVVVVVVVAVVVTVVVVVVVAAALTLYRTALLEQLTGSQLARNSPHFMEPEGSLPHSQMPVTCPYPEPAQSSPYPHIPLLGDPS